MARPKGAMNRRTMELRQALEAKGFDLAAEIIELYRDADTPVTAKVDLIKLIIEYSLSKPTQAPQATLDAEYDDVTGSMDTAALIAIATPK